MVSGPAESELVVRAAVATGLGVAVGIERAIHAKASGVRTLSLVSLGACAFTVAGFAVLDLPGSDLLRPDPGRIAAQVVTGVGFLGAGTIFVAHGSRVRGLTSAADIWVVAAVGVLCGVGFLLTAAAVTALDLIVVVLLRPGARWLERRFASARERGEEEADEAERGPHADSGG